MQEQRVWPLLVLQTLMRGAMTGSASWRDHGTNIHLPPPVEEHLDRILKPFGRSAWSWEMGVQRTIEKGRIPIPWAIIAWEKEYPVQEHFCSIRGDDGKEVFFHRSGLNAAEYDALSEGDTVEYVVQEGPRGARAENVRGVSPGEATESAQ